jgi:hypothetical protein
MQAEIESVAKALPAGQQEDFRRIMSFVTTNLQANSPGGNLLRPGGTPAGANTAPTGGGLSVAGANGTFQITVKNPAVSGNSSSVWHQIQYSTVVSFTANVTQMPNSTATSITLPLPGATYFFRIRFSFDQITWSSWILAASSAVNSGLVTSGATSDASAFNQTNYADVTSTAVGSTTEVQVQGASGPLTSLVRQKGPTQQVLPSSTIFGVAPGSDQFVAYDGEGYVLRPTLAGVLAEDDLAPIGKVSVVSTAAPTLPVIVPVISGGYVIGYSITSGGAGASEPYTLTFGSVGGGAGAVPGEQTIENGVLTAIAPGNPGNGMYSGGTTVTASGGVGGGTSGGGTALGGNGGRLTAV